MNRIIGSLIPFILSLIMSSNLYAQENIDLLSAPPAWRNEIIKFPLAFAPSLDYQGIGDVRFSNGWSKKDSEEFWTYAYVWQLDQNPMINPEKLEKDIATYFDGLMQMIAAGSGLEKDQVPKSLTIFQQSGNDQFLGKIRFYDAFFLKDMQTLNIKVTNSYCSESKKYHLLFKFSPKQFDSNIWKVLDNIKMKNKCTEK